MKRNSLLTLAAIGFCTGSAHAATYSYSSDFSGLAEGGSLAGVDGWTQNEANYSDVNGVSPWAFGLLMSGTPAAAIGGYYNTDPTMAPDGKFIASHTLEFTDGMIFNMNFAIVDSEGFTVGEDLLGTERNSFRVGFKNGGSEVFGLVFTPEYDEDPLNNPADTWSVTASSGGKLRTSTNGSGGLVSATSAIIEAGPYKLSLSLLPDGADLKYRFTMSSVINSQSFTGRLPGFTGAIDQLEIGIDPEASQYGTNHFVLNGIVAIVPEPSSLLLVGAALGGFALRRRRAVI